MSTAHAFATDADAIVAPAYPRPAPALPPAPPAPETTPTSPVPTTETLEPLGAIPGDWERLEGITVGSETIDMVLIGPNGVFAIHLDGDPRPAAVRPGLGVFRAGSREPEAVKRALRGAEALRSALAHLPGDLFPYPVLVTSTPGESGHRLGRLLVVRPGRLPEAIWRHVSRPLRRSERRSVREALG